TRHEHVRTIATSLGRNGHTDFLQASDVATQSAAIDFHPARQLRATHAAVRLQQFKYTKDACSRVIHAVTWYAVSGRFTPYIGRSLTRVPETCLHPRGAAHAHALTCHRTTAGRLAGIRSDALCRRERQGRVAVCNESGSRGERAGARVRFPDGNL